MTTAALTPSTTDAVRASDADREKALHLLRDHWLAGRLTLDEYEDRCDEAATGRFIADLEGALRELPYPLPPPAAPAPVAAAPPAAAPVRDEDDGGRGWAAALSLLLGPMSLPLIPLTFGMGVVVALPMSAAGWALGHEARRSSRRAVRALAAIGESFSIFATAICGLVAVAWVSAILG